MPVTIDGTLHEATFQQRPNRFVVLARMNDRSVKAHCPNPGRLGEFRQEGTPYLLRRRPDASAEHATRYSVVAAKDGRFHVGSPRALGEIPERPCFEEGCWVVLDTGMANRLVADALTQGTLEEAFGVVDAFTREPRAGSGRFDFAWERDGARALAEVKSVTLIGNDGTTALFPDAPTERGTRHVRKLAERAGEGLPSTLAFVVLREDAERIAPNTFTDPAFASALQQARDAGVELVGLRSQIDLERGRVGLGARIPVVLDPGQAATGVSSKGELLDPNRASG